jgi:hypothetical protein
VVQRGTPERFATLRVSAVPNVREITTPELGEMLAPLGGRTHDFTCAVLPLRFVNDGLKSRKHSVAPSPSYHRVRGLRRFPQVTFAQKRTKVAGHRLGRQPRVAAT